MTTILGRVINAPTEETGPVPAYRIFEYNVPWEKEISHFNEKTRVLDKTKVIIEDGYLVVFPRGHSMLIEKTDEALEAHGFGAAVPLVNLNFGEAEVNKDAKPSPATKRVIEKAA